MTRTGKDLVNATRPFHEASRARSWAYVGSTVAALAACLTLAGLAPWWPLRLAASVLGGLVMARTFILCHDFMHGSMLRGSWPARLLLHGLGMLMLVPPRWWRASHNYHHANVAEPNGPAIGSFPVMTTDVWRTASFWRRLHYRLSRHPLTILGAYLSIFVVTVTLEPLIRQPRKYWDALLALAVHGGSIVGLWLLGGWSTAFFVLMLPYAINAALGSYLFYAQHNFRGVRMLPEGEWTYGRAALESSSYLEAGPLLRWFLGNINYHHVHHLNPSIPFYRLPEAMAALPELQRPTVTSLRPRDIRDCLAANLWDDESGEMISYRQAAAREEAAAAARPARSPRATASAAAATMTAAVPAPGLSSTLQSGLQSIAGGSTDAV